MLDCENTCDFIRRKWPCINLTLTRSDIENAFSCRFISDEAWFAFVRFVSDDMPNGVWDAIEGAVNRFADTPPVIHERETTNGST